MGKKKLEHLPPTLFSARSLKITQQRRWKGSTSRIWFALCKPQRFKISHRPPRFYLRLLLRTGSLVEQLEDGSARLARWRISMWCFHTQRWAGQKSSPLQNIHKLTGARRFQRLILIFVLNKKKNLNAVYTQKQHESKIGFVFFFVIIIFFCTAVSLLRSEKSGHSRVSRYVSILGGF